MSVNVNIFEVIKRETELLSLKMAVIEGGDRLTYGELIKSAERFAKTLNENGVSQFHRVGLLCDDSIDYIIASLAILSISAVVVPVSPKQKAEEIDSIIRIIDVDFLVAESGFRQVEFGDQSRPYDLFKKKFFVVKRIVLGCPKAEYFTTNPAFIRFSSGTTGTSKGVILSHEAIVERVNAANQGLRITSDDVILWVLSMRFHFVVTILLFLKCGATIVLCGHRFPDSLIEGVSAHRGTFIYASPFYYSLLSRMDGLPGDVLKQIRLAVSTTIKLPESIAEEFFEKFGFELAEAYGIIEVGLPFVRLSGGKDKRGSVGRPLPDFKIKIDNKDADGVGEISIQGKGMLDAYYSPWQGRNDIFIDGWFKTGDLGMIDADGYLFIVGRNKEVINLGGLKIFAQEVEAVLNRHPQVKESLVYGVAHKEYGQLPMAKIVIREEKGVLKENDLRRFCNLQLAQYKVPKGFEFVSNLPRTASGKIKR
ncbi:MAG: class I adenylate-forming enzyme family protein [Alphaproteobacteria bacterium]